MQRLLIGLLIFLIIQSIGTIAIFSWFYEVADFSSTKNQDTYTFGSKEEKFISSLEASIAFDSILAIFSIFVIFYIRKKWLSFQAMIIFSVYFCLFFFGKGMAGLFHLFDTTNKNIHDSIKKNMDVLENYGMPLPDIVVAWQYSYYSMIASLIGEFLCAFSIGIILLIEGRKVYNTLIIK